jgi:glycosyltransferase involved in cell wall biosynthesis
VRGRAVIDTATETPADDITFGLDVLLVLPLLFSGGAERVAVLLANELAARGTRVGVALFRKKGAFLDLVDPGIPIIEVGGGGWFKAIVPLVRLLRRTRPATMIGVMVSCNVAAVVAGKLSMTGVRTVLTEHSQVDRSAEFHGSNSRAYSAISRVYPWADGIVCVSDGVRDSLCRFSGMAPDRMRVIHNPIVPADLPEKAAEPCLHPWIGNPGCPLILAVGRLTKAKNYPMLLRAFALLRGQRPARLLILGEGEERAELEALSAELGIGADLDMPGFQTNPYAYMSRADLFVLSSAWEGFPTVLVEALALGPPVVATDCASGPREILLDGALGALVPVNDPAAFAAAMSRVLDAPGPRAARVARGGSFTVARAADAYLHMFAELSR